MPLLVATIGGACALLVTAPACVVPPPLPVLPPARATGLPDELHDTPRMPDPPPPLTRDEGTFGPLPTADELTDGVTVDEAVAIALNEDPTLRALAAEVRAFEADAQQAAAPPNPRFRYEVEGVNLTEFDAGATVHTMTIDQEFDIGGVRGAMGLERYARARVGWLDHYRRRWLLSRAVERLFLEAALAEKAFSHALDRRDAMLELLTIAPGGRVLDDAADRAFRLLAAQLDLDVHEAWSRLARVRQDIVTQMGVADALVGPVQASLPELDARRLAELAPDAITRLLFTQHGEALLIGNLDLRRKAFEIAAAREGISVANSQSWPDLTARLGLRFRGNSQDLELLFGFSIPIPVFDRKREGERAALARVDAAIERYRGTARELLLVASSRAMELASAVVRFAALEETLLPLALEHFQAVRDDWQAGTRSYTEVVLAAQTWIASVQDALESEAAAQAAAFDLRTLTGPEAPATAHTGGNER